MKKLIGRLKRDFKDIKSIKRNRKRVSNSIGALLNKKYGHLKNPSWDDKASYKAWFRSLEISFMSQNGEDGVLLEIFDNIGISNYTSIEFGIGNGEQCNSANLIKNHGWKGLMIEGSTAKASHAQNYYKDDDVQVLNNFITKDNINALFKDAGFTGEVDLLSVDIDGNDYWIWKEIEIVSPRVVVVEFNNSFGNDEALTIPYDPTFDRFKYHRSGIYHGMSLPAAVKLGQQKGYKYVGCDSLGVNAFFIRGDQTMKKFKDVDHRDFFEEQHFRNLKLTTREQNEILRNFKLAKV